MLNSRKPIIVLSGNGIDKHAVALRAAVFSDSQYRRVCVQVDLKPASDVLAGAMARAASQSTIHPLDTLKVCRILKSSRSLLHLLSVKSVSVESPPPPLPPSCGTRQKTD